MSQQARQAHREHSENLAEQGEIPEKRVLTMGSLFAGIGGFRPWLRARRFQNCLAGRNRPVLQKSSGKAFSLCTTIQRRARVIPGIS
jgi:hypothetical protein